MWRVVLVFLAILGGFWMGKGRDIPKRSFSVHPEKDFPITEHKSFAIVIYAHNQALWCERALRSVFEQDYDHYRVILVDDGSLDGTAEKANQFIVDNNQADRVILIRNETKIGQIASLYRAIDSCLDREIVIPLDAKNWLAHPLALSRLNAAYQNPDIWFTLSRAIEYPSYDIREAIQISYYASLFKQIRLEDLYQKGHFATHPDSYLFPIQDMAAGRICKVQEPIAFLNTVSPMKVEERPSEIAAYKPLAHFPLPHEAKKADILVSSADRPLQLYACLESIQRYITGFENFTVLYQASNSQFAAGYEQVKKAFPIVRFIEDPKQSKIISDYVLLASDDAVAKDFVDLHLCIDQMEKTGAHAFYLCFGKHIQTLPPSLPLSSNIYAWDIQIGEGEWASPKTDMALVKKQDVSSCSEKGIGLYFEHSKMVNIPAEICTNEELLAKFNQGLKIDIEPLYKVENRETQVDYIPEFVTR